MTNLFIIVVDDRTNTAKILNWLQTGQYKIVLIGLLDSSKENKYQQERSCWHNLFAIQEGFEKAGYSVSIGTEKGSLFNIISTMQSLEADLLIIPKTKFLTLASDEYEDFLEQVSCPIMLY